MARFHCAPEEQKALSAIRRGFYTTVWRWSMRFDAKYPYEIKRIRFRYENTCQQLIVLSTVIA
jgi:hypothetical protein